MRQYFTDLGRIKRTAKENMETGLAVLKRWWTNKYKLPPNHDLFLDQSESDLSLEMFEDWMLRKRDLEATLTDRADMLSSEQSREMQRELDGINEALGESAFVVDDLIDKWERELNEGKTPDLSEGLNNA